jgi:hypothetical protein
MRHPRLVLVVVFAVAALGVAGALLARGHATAASPAPPAPIIEPSAAQPASCTDRDPAAAPLPPLQDASSAGQTACRSCVTKDVCTQVHDRCQCARGRGRCEACPDGTLICLLQ